MKVTIRTVRDHAQSASLKGGVITITSHVGKEKVSNYSITLEEWNATFRTLNPVFNQSKLVKQHTAHYEVQPGGFTQASRIRDAQIEAIRKLVKAIEILKSVSYENHAGV